MLQHVWLFFALLFFLNLATFVSLLVQLFFSPRRVSREAWKRPRMIQINPNRSVSWVFLFIFSAFIWPADESSLVDDCAFDDTEPADSHAQRRTANRKEDPNAASGEWRTYHFQVEDYSIGSSDIEPHSPSNNNDVRVFFFIDILVFRQPIVAVFLFLLLYFVRVLIAIFLFQFVSILFRQLVRFWCWFRPRAFIFFMCGT